MPTCPLADHEVQRPVLAVLECLVLLLRLF
jgi:hypothetical protein